MDSTRKRGVTFVQITAEPIDADSAADFVRDVRDGAVVSFSGVVRDDEGGPSVYRLEYEAFVEMAGKETVGIVRAARDRWAIRNVSVVHRLGSVGVCETSVVIAVSGVHRAEAFDACRYVIDRLKACVPIWKREVGASGSRWARGQRPGGGECG